MEFFTEAFLILAIYLGPLFTALLVCGLISDCVLPRCPRLLHFLERVFDVDLEGDLYDE